MFSEKKVTFQIDAPYFALIKNEKKIKQLLFIFHGYAQLAEDIINNYTQLVSENLGIVFPQGLNRAYVKGFNGKVGANWMTSKEKLTDIQSHITYINSIINDLKKNIDFSKVEITAVGFSQGTTMVAHCLHLFIPVIKKIIFWAGPLPVDLGELEKDHPLTNEKIYYVFGKNDKFADKSVLSQQLNILDSINANYKVVNYSGGHEVNLKVLQNILAE